MPPVSIENPILNSPFAEPTRHFRFDEDGITNEIAVGRRRSTYFIPIAKPKTRGGAQLSLPGDWVGERMTDNDFINRVREQVSAWRSARYPGITAVTRDLLSYWQAPDREKPLFFCQIEALETAIFLAEVAGNRQPWIENKLREDGQARNPGLYRIAFKMATGSGKTVVMAMLIAWQALNKLANAQDKRFSDAFLVVTPGITIRDRLQVLRPNLTGNYYQERDLLTPDQLQALLAAKIEVANFHGFMRRDAGTFEGTASLTKKVLAGPAGDEEAAAAASGKRTEATAIEIVRRFGNGLPDVVDVVDVQDDDRGWDLEFVMRDGGTIPVEVKGSSGSGPFVLTGNEWNAARDHAEYVLYHVVDLTTPARTRMRVFRNLRDRLKEDHVSAAGWAVTGWRNLEPEEISVKPTGDASSVPTATRPGEQGGPSR